MGTEIELTVGGFTLDWAKNSRGTDHGFLFQEGDRARRRSDQVDYGYYEEHPDEDVAPMEQAFVRPLARVLPRLNLLGHTLEAARAEYEGLLSSDDDADGGDPGPDGSGFMTFGEFCAFACRHPLSSLDATFIDRTDDDERERLVRGRFTDEAEIARIPRADMVGDLYWSEQSYFRTLVGVLSAYSMLQVLGLSTENQAAEVTWQYGPLVESGWAFDTDFYPGARRRQKVLVATEGSSDAHILRHALDLLQPDVADFFRFIDVSDRHPFPGTGALVKFAEGLVKIDVQNLVLFLFDNDAEGVDAFRRVQALGLPANMRTMILPHLEVFREFPARGPEGVTTSDINGRAAGIECYLDLRLPGMAAARVLWSNYKRDVDDWQGALEFKETYMRRFLEQTAETLREGEYDTSKLEQVLAALIAEATTLATSAEAEWI